MEKVKKVQKWKTMRVPENLWRTIKTHASKKGIKIYEEIESKYE